MPVPERLTAVGEPVALLATLTLPLTAPPLVGSNVTESATDWPAPSTVPASEPAAVKPFPDKVTLEIVTLALPVLVRVVESEPLLSSSTFPKLRVEGLALSDAVAARPVPERLMASEEGVPFVASDTVPLAAPAAEGSNVTLNEALLPAAIVVEVLNPVSPKPEPLTVTWEKVSVAPPEFVSVIGRESLVFTVTDPNATLEELDEIFAPDPDAAAIVSARVARPVPALFVALSVTLEVPLAVGVPEIAPVEVFTETPPGKPLAA
jgi:hypothetical protein